MLKESRTAWNSSVLPVNTNAAKTVCSMLNGFGGIVRFGVDDKGALLGQQISRLTLEDIANAMRRIEALESDHRERVLPGGHH